MPTIKTNCPRDCYDGCGILVHIEEGQRPRVVGDPDHPTSRGQLCSKCGVSYNGIWQDEAARVTTPLRRTGAKGSGEFEAISWADALAEISSKFNGIIDTDGAEAILGCSYTGTLGLLGFGYPSRLMNHLGASLVDYGSICNHAGYLAWTLLFGNAAAGFDPRTAKDSSCIMVWGANPSHCAPHMHEHWLKESPAKVVVIDPLRTETAAAADLHLQPRPGTDAALAFALLNVLREQGHFDETFIAENVVGADEINPTIDACTAEWGEAQTGVPAADIVLAAKLYGAGPALLWAGQSLQRQPQGGNIMRAAGLLPALTGNVGKPGAGFYYLNDTHAIAGADDDYLVAAQLSLAEPKMVGSLDLAERLAGDEFKAFMVWNTNPLASCSDQQKLREACSREDLFTVVLECFETDTARYADIVLPAASFLEVDDIVASYMNMTVGVQSKVIEPLGESFSNQEIFRRIAAAMSLTEPALFESDEEVIAALLEQMQFPGSFADLQRQGFFWVNGEEPLIMHQEREFETPSGKIEIASEKAEKMGLPRVPHAGVDAAPEPGQYRLISPGSKWRLNDEYGNDPKLMRRAGAAELILSAADAADLGVADGQNVSVSTANGSLNLIAQIDDMVQPGTVVSYKGRWPSLESSGNNINYLHVGEKCDMAEGTSIHGMIVSISPA
jgi:anaerobic selenocysteine-containing dehydrogenase